MAQRKLQQEIDKCFKRVAEGVQAFEAIFEKIQQTSNASQKERHEDALKREIKKLQRQRDQIKTWAANNEIKDKKPLLDQRKLIETQMEKFKAVEKEMKTKAYSKEGLSAAAKLDPKEKEKLEACQFVNAMVEELERQIETMEAEAESLQVHLRKGKKDQLKASRVQEIERLTERHKWHQSRLELIQRSMENGGVEADQVLELRENIKYYVDNNQDVDFVEDDAMYDDLHLDEEEDLFGMNNELDRVSSQDAQSIQDDVQEADSKGSSGAGSKPRPPSGAELPGASARRPSTQMKSPLPVLATLHTPLANTTNGANTGNMKPALPPTRAPGETLKYASAAAAAAAAAAASDRNGVGIAPLPPPSGAPASSAAASHINSPPQAPSTIAAASGLKTSTANSPRAEISRLAETAASLAQKAAAATTTSAMPPHANNVGSPSPVEAPAHPSASVDTGMASGASGASNVTPAAALEEKVRGKKVESTRLTSDRPRADSKAPGTAQEVPDVGGSVQKNITSPTNAHDTTTESHESIYHLPPGLQDLLQSFETTKNRVSSATTMTSSSSSASASTSGPTLSDQRLLAASFSQRPDSIDADKPRHYRPLTRFNSPSYYPQEPLPLLDDPRLYQRIDTDTLFYVFYYRQGTYQQYLAAKSLKGQSWRFNKQYQTWFQRHEEPKTITEEFEHGTYRFFDYESTWMNRRKAEFKFEYRFLEDDI